MCASDRGERDSALTTVTRCSQLLGLLFGLGLGRALGRRSDVVRAFDRSGGGLTLIARVGLIGGRFLGRRFAGVGGLDDFLFARSGLNGSFLGDIFLSRS